MSNAADILVPTFEQLLRALAQWIDKGAAFEAEHQRPPDELVAARLTDDMYPLAGQVLLCCFMAQEAVCKYRGESVSEAVEELRRAAWVSAEQPGTLDGAKAHIEHTLLFLDGIQPSDLGQGGNERLQLVLPSGMTFEMSGEAYARDWSLPQFYFHLVIAYAILRQRGVELGKKDYVPYLWQHLTPGTKAP